MYMYMYMYIVISKKLLKDIRTCTVEVEENVIKMKNSLLVIFDEISWVTVQGRWPTFRVTLKILKNSMSNYSIL